MQQLSFTSDVSIVKTFHWGLPLAHVRETTDYSNVIIFLLTGGKKGRRLGSLTRVVRFLFYTQLSPKTPKLAFITKLFPWAYYAFLVPKPCYYALWKGKNSQVVSLWWKATNALRPVVHQCGISLHLTTPKGTLNTQIWERCMTNHWCVISWVEIWWVFDDLMRFIIYKLLLYNVKKTVKAVLIKQMYF